MAMPWDVQEDGVYLNLVWRTLNSPSQRWPGMSMVADSFLIPHWKLCLVYWLSGTRQSREELAVISVVIAFHFNFYFPTTAR